LACGFPGQPYFLEEAQELAITARAKNNKIATALFFIFDRFKISTLTQ
jgi:hypothetical protein